MKLRTFTTSQLPSFTERLAVIPDFLPEETFQALSKEIQSLAGGTRSYLPGHKKGNTISYEELRASAPQVVAFYQSSEYQEILSNIIGTKIAPTPTHDNSSLSILVYEKPGDHIGWHYDHNFYKGRHFTVLIAIENRGNNEDGLSSARLLVRTKNGDTVVPTPPNLLVLFEGSKTLHRALPIKEGERRVVLSMTYCTDPRNSLAKEIMRRIKDTAFFGIKALWK